ncbi:MAG: CRTAC1 family protein [Chthonomonadales bacterium]
MKSAPMAAAAALLLSASCARKIAPAYKGSAAAPPAITFQNVSQAAGLRFRFATSPPTRPRNILEVTGGGAGFLDFDGDGWPDIVLVGERVGLFRNLGNGTFQDVSSRSGISVKGALMGCAVADYDNDGRVDVLDNSQNMPAALYHNEARAGHFITLRLEGTRTNRDGIGAKVIIEVAGKQVLAEVRDGSSYASTSDRRIHFGLASKRYVERLTVRWPSGSIQTFHRVPADHFYVVREDSGIAPDPRIR